jgi:hypothetical protein
MAGNPLTNPNWAPELADTVERIVGQVRDKATSKVVVVVRAVVFGVIIACTAVATLVLAIILGTKLLQRIVNIGGWIDADSSVWVSYLVLGGILTLGGLLCMYKRESRESRTTAKASK